MDVLQKHYEVELSEQPDFILCSMFGLGFYEYARYDCVRIFFSGENYSPDFTAVDYAMGFDRMEYPGRFLRVPEFFVDIRRLGAGLMRPTPEQAQRMLREEKSEFCNFIYGDSDAIPQREGLFRCLDAKKAVVSAGSWLNNQDGFKVEMLTTKAAYQKKFRFTIAVESCSMPGFVTEKITDAYLANSIPIYYGDPTVSEIFDERSFVNAHRYPDMEAAAQEVMRIEQDEQRMIEMLCAPVFKQEGYLEKLCADFENFLCGIFDQDPAQAIRRARNGQPKVHNDYLKFTSKLLASKHYRNYIVRKSYINKYLPWIKCE